MKYQDQNPRSHDTVVHPPVQSTVRDDVLFYEIFYVNSCYDNLIEPELSL